MPHITTHTLSPSGTITIPTPAGNQYLLFFFSTSSGYMGMWQVIGRGSTAATVDTINSSSAVTVTGHAGGGIDVAYSGSVTTAYVTMVKI